MEIYPFSYALIQAREMGSAFEYFSLKGMELSDDAIEIEYKHDNMKEALDLVLEHF